MLDPRSMPYGKRRLIQAALRLSGKQRGFGALGLREIGREAGLNPNTFYRHFRDLDDLGNVIVEQISGDLRKALRRLRRTASDVHEAAATTVRCFFDFVRANSDAFMVAGRELHGASPAMRGALRQVKSAMALEMAEDVRVAGLMPTIEDALLLDVTTAIVDQMFFLALEYLERPKERRAIVDRAVRFIVMLAAGALTLQAAPRTAKRVREQA